ncbi:hypothetical protein [Actinomadura kijaniata]|uniref:hypothetical protein n=1 Tax=Actinomadura kijaniata TaxID=46161 RepID=UPI000A81977D|nr:hypothetical protein [Actinomadura kijaniata]
MVNTASARRKGMGAAAALTAVLAPLLFLALPDGRACGCRLPPPLPPRVPPCSLVPADLAERLVPGARPRDRSAHGEGCLWQRGRRLTVEVDPQPVGYQRRVYPQRYAEDGRAHAVRAVPGLDAHTWTEKGTAHGAGMARDHLVTVELTGRSAERDVVRVLRAALTELGE